MINLEDHANLLKAISQKLKKKIIVYAIGGTAMMLQGLKDSTVDIDLVFENDGDKEEFKAAAKSLGYKDMDPSKVYGPKDNTPDMLTLGNERFDLFVDKIIDYTFSDTMKKRSSKTYEFSKNLILKIADYHDIIILKCATKRTKDMDDIKSIIETKEINWDTIIDESKKQLELGEEHIFIDLGGCLEDLRKTLKGKIPQKVLDMIYNLLKDQANKKNKKRLRT